MLSNKFKVAALFAVIVIGGAAATLLHGGAKASSGDNFVPKCDSKEAMSEVKNTIKNRNPNVELIDYSNLDEVLNENQARWCIGDIVLSTGSGTALYKFSQAKSDPSRIITEVQLLSHEMAVKGRKLAEFLKQAEAGNSDAQYQLGLTLAYNPRGDNAVVNLNDPFYPMRQVDKSNKEAIKWFLKSAAQGNAFSISYLNDWFPNRDKSQDAAIAAQP